MSQKTSFTVEQRVGGEDSEVWKLVSLGVAFDYSHVSVQAHDNSEGCTIEAAHIEQIVSSSKNCLFGFVYHVAATTRTDILIFRARTVEGKDKILHKALLPLYRSAKAKRANERMEVLYEPITCSVTDIERFPYHAETSLSNLDDLVGGANFAKVHRTGVNRIRIDTE